MSKSYFVSIEGQPTGPFSFSEVQAKLSAKQLSASDYIVADGSSEWVFVPSHPDFADFSASIGVSPSPKAKDFPQGQGWFLLKDGDNHGPFSQIEIVKMLQRKEIYDFDYLWQEPFANWRPVSEVPEFTPEAILRLMNSPDVDKEDIFFRRRHSRAPYAAALIIHNNKAVFKGRSMEIGAGGAGVLIDNTAIAPGQTLFLHFKPGSGVPPFNAVCEVVSKRVIEGSLCKYGVKFVNINQATRESIQTFTIQKVA